MLHSKISRNNIWFFVIFSYMVNDIVKGTINTGVSATFDSHGVTRTSSVNTVLDGARRIDR